MARPRATSSRLEKLKMPPPPSGQMVAHFAGRMKWLRRGGRLVEARYRGGSWKEREVQAIPTWARKEGTNG